MKFVKLFCLLSLVFLCELDLIGQNAFIDKINIPSSIVTYTSATTDGNLHVAYPVKSNNTNMFYDGIQVLKYNSCQEIEWSQEYQFDGSSIMIDALLTHSNGSIYLAGRVEDGTEDIDLFLLRLNEDGSGVFSTVYRRPLRQFIYSIDETASGNIVLFGISYYNATNSRNYFLTVNENGEFIDAFLNGEAGVWGRGIVCNDGDYMGRMGPRIFKVKPDGTPVWVNTFVGVSNVSTPVEVEDGFIFSSNRIFNGVPDPSFLFKLDLDGNLIWVSKGYRANGYASLELHPNGNILCLDTDYDPDQTSVFHLGILEFSSEGEQLSNRSFLTTYGGSFVFGNDMVLLPDEEGFAFSAFGGGIRDTLFVGRLNTSLETSCQFTDNFNEDTIKTVTQQNNSMSFDPLTFDVENTQFEVTDVNLTAERICQTLTFDYPTSLPDTIICEGDGILLSVNIPDADIEWPDGSTADTFLVSEAGDYSVQVSQCGIESTLLVQRVLVEDCPCRAVLPNAFTPDGDGENDIFTLLKTCDVSDYRMMIYNRWGELVFESNNAEKGWNGTHNGIAAPMDSYIYRCFYNIENGGQIELMEKKGSLTLIR
ncbi:MAG: gliding motility-associated C-terminal domain-containing protein [Saprospiraceae bacterium]